MVEKKKLTEDVVLSSIIDHEKNNAEGIDVLRLYLNSSTVINWKCKNNHTFKEKVGVMYKRKNKCFYCTGRLVWSGENDLQTLYPEIAKEFDVEKNGISPDRISPKDTKSYWWTCERKHPSFYQSVEHRVTRKTVCRCCSGRQAISGENDLETLFPEIAKEWDYKKNEGILPKEVPAYTYKTYWWICPKGHSYRKKVVERTKFHKSIDCSKCIKASSTSFPEQAIYYYAKKCFPDAVNRYKEPFENGMELDIYIPSFKYGIEYDGMAFHKSIDQHDRELRKYQACKEFGIKLIRIKESQDSWTDTADKIFYVKKRMNDEDMSLFLYSFFSSVFFFCAHTFKSSNNREKYLNTQYGFPTDFNVARDRPEILDYLVAVDNSFGVQYPELAKLWCKPDNGTLTPFMFPSGSNYEATWECPKCGNTWKSPIVSIVQRKVKTCRACSMKANGKNTTKAKTIKYGSLAERSDLLLRQWDTEANGDLSPYEVPLNYTKDVAWKCDKCGHKWINSPVSRLQPKGKIANCPHCTGRVAMPGVDDLETLYPNIAKEWDYQRNNGILPSQIKPFTNKKYYWVCPTCNKPYLAYPGNRVNGSGCPDCAHKLVGKKNSKKVGKYDEEGNLISSFDGLHEAARSMGICPNSIFQAVKNEKKSKGYYWRYI